MPTATDDDFLDGCDLDFAAAAVDEETAQLLPLFPSGDATEAEIVGWRSLFADPELLTIAPLSAAASAAYDGSGRDLGIAARLRAAGLRVVEVAGWQTRGSATFAPRGSVDHHTAGPRSGNAPSLGICIAGRSDLPGPLCHVLVARDLTCYVIASGRANHAGLGDWRGLTGNSSVYGVERENVGTKAEPWSAAQTIHAAKVHRALAGGRFTAATVCRHAEWAPTRKIDTHSIAGATLRAMIAAPTPDPEEPDMDKVQDERLKTVEAGIVRLTQYLTPRQGLKVLTSGPEIGKQDPAGEVVGDLWRWALAMELERQGKTTVLVDRIAARVVKALPPGSGGTPLTEEAVRPLVEEAVRSVLGGLDE